MLVTLPFALAEVPEAGTGWDTPKFGIDSEDEVFSYTTVHDTVCNSIIHVHVHSVYHMYMYWL